MDWNYWIQTSQTGYRLYGDSFPHGECSLYKDSSFSFVLSINWEHFAIHF